MSAIKVIKSASDPQDVGNKCLENWTSKWNPPQSDEVKTIRKCIRKGSRVCYTDLENITVLRKIPEKPTTSRISFLNSSENEIFDQMDSYRSGESLFKTFTFEQTRDINDPETQKCIEFWKSVMEKNLAPIKCTLLESDKRDAEKKQWKSSKRAEKKAPPQHSTKQEPTTPTLELNSAKIWSDALKEIKRKKLDQLKLYTRERCAYCRDPFTKDLFQDLGIESKEEEMKQIQALNDWKENDQMLLEESSRKSLRMKFSGKAKKASSPHLLDTKQDKMPQREPSLAQSKGGNSASKRPASLRKQSVFSYESPGRISTVRLASAEIQAPMIKCACESDSCICPHKAATRNSRTSFIEIAKKNMLDGDRSSADLSHIMEQSCVCEQNLDPWAKITCYSEPCPAKNADLLPVEVSCSLFDIHEKYEKQRASMCVCRRDRDAICKSNVCENKESQGSLIEGTPKIDNEKEEPCICVTTEDTIPCGNEICPTKFHKKDGECNCQGNLPWSKAICHTWRCPYDNKLLNRKRKSEDKLLERPPPIKDKLPACNCLWPDPWSQITCSHERCRAKPRREPARIGYRKKAFRTSSKMKSASKESLWKKDKKEKDKVSSSSRETMQSNKEKNKPKKISLQKCACEVSPPWKIVTCHSELCDEKDVEIPKKETEKLVTMEGHPIKQNSSECICADKTLEQTCRAYKCRNRIENVDYPPTCICPKGVEETEHEHFKCTSEECKMKRVDKSCICPNQGDAVCNTQICNKHPQGSKTLKRVKKPLKYDSKCICKIRGLATTQEVSCTAPDCPFRTKHSKPRRKQSPELFVPPPPQMPPEPVEAITKCICNTKDVSITINCPSVTCRRKSKSYDDEDDEEISESEMCICKKVIGVDDSEQEVICKQVQCHKSNLGDGASLMSDKCICTNLEGPCDEPFCLIQNEKMRYKEESVKKGKPYCYICGRYDCVSDKKKPAKGCREHIAPSEDDLL